jgi:GPH family glycoside/pentoside/hexuronide:cation symporter
LEYKTASTGLIFSSSSMAQKFGGAIGGAAVLWLLSAAGYVTDGSVAFGAQPESAISCLWLLMSFIPAIVSALSVCVVWFYPLTTKRVEEIVEKLKVQRAQR